MKKPYLALIGLILIYGNANTYVMASIVLSPNEQDHSESVIPLTERPTYMTASNDSFIRIADYQKNYMLGYAKYMKTLKPLKVTYIQPLNKTESCKIWTSHRDTLELGKYGIKVYWDGKCKNGYANGLGREFVMGDGIYGWSLAIYTNKKPIYYVEKDNVMSSLIHGVCHIDDATWYGVKKITTDSETVTMIGMENEATKINLLEISYSEGEGIRYYAKEYPNFKYQEINYTNDPTSIIEFEFAIYDENNVRNGWGYGKGKKERFYTSGEYINDKPQFIVLPPLYKQRFHYIIDEIYEAKKKALKAQKKALKVKKQYQDIICKKRVSVDFMNNESYKAICSH